jgi:hypothetical protein
VDQLLRGGAPDDPAPSAAYVVDFTTGLAQGAPLPV